MINYFFCLRAYFTDNAATNVTVATRRCNSDADGVIFHHIHENIHRPTPLLKQLLFSLRYYSSRINLLTYLLTYLLAYLLTYLLTYSMEQSPS